MSKNQRTAINMAKHHNKLILVRRLITISRINALKELEIQWLESHPVLALADLKLHSIIIDPSSEIG